jgi:drug/metabolite transporter (DMT)-like permease
MTTAWFAVALTIVASFISGIAPNMLKKGAKKFTLNPRKLLRKPSLLLKNWGVLLGVTCDVTSAIINIVALRFGDLSVIFPVGSLLYVWSCLFAVKINKEKMNTIKWAGVLLIVIGVIMVTRGI